MMSYKSARELVVLGNMNLTAYSVFLGIFMHQFC